MTQYTRLHASNLLLAALGNPNAGGDAAYWLAGWSSHEITCGVGCSHPRNNLWACGQSVPGSSTWNPPHHVQNYPTLAQAILAMVANLHDGLYNNLVGALAANNIDRLTNGSVAPDLQNWCGSVCYSGDTAGFISEGKAHAGDLFDDSGGGVASDIALSSVGDCGFCLVGQPFGCSKDQICAQMNEDGTVYLPAFGIAGTCVTNAYFKDHSQNADGSAVQPDGKGGDSPTICHKIKTGSQPAPPTQQGWTQALANVLDFLSGKAGWGRVLNAILGLAAIAFGMVILLAIITGKAESSQAVQTATKAGEMIGVA